MNIISGTHNFEIVYASFANEEFYGTHSNFHSQRWRMKKCPVMFLHLRVSIFVPCLSFVHSKNVKFIFLSRLPSRYNGRTIRITNVELSNRVPSWLLPQRESSRPPMNKEPQSTEYLRSECTKCRQVQGAFQRRTLNGAIGVINEEDVRALVTRGCSSWSRFPRRGPHISVCNIAARSFLCHLDQTRRLSQEKSRERSHTKALASVEIM